MFDSTLQEVLDSFLGQVTREAEIAAHQKAVHEAQAAEWVTSHPEAAQKRKDLAKWYEEEGKRCNLKITQAETLLKFLKSMRPTLPPRTPFPGY